jgi:hypothetical protein
MPHWLAQAESPYCWAFAAMTAFEYNWAIRNGGPAPGLAIQPILDRTQRGGGAPHQLALEELLRHGTCPAKIYPHLGRPGRQRSSITMAYRAIAWGTVTADGSQPTVAEIKQALLDHGPLVVGIHTSRGFHAYKRGIFNEHPKFAGPPIDHSVVIVGWDDRKGDGGCWRIQNSWGPQWGQGGFMWIEYGSNNVGTDACWVQAESNQYRLPPDAHERITGRADPFYRWSTAKEVPLPPPPELPVITPAEAQKHQGERVVVEFDVRVVGLVKPENHVGLYSTPNFRDRSLVMVVLLHSELHRFPVSDPQVLMRQYGGKRLRVRGSLQPYALVIDKAPSNLLVIEVSDPGQIEVVR